MDLLIKELRDIISGVAPFTNYEGVPEFLSEERSDFLTLMFDSWKGFKSETDEFKELRRSFLSASNLKILKLQRVNGLSERRQASELSALESELFSKLLKESRSIRRFTCNYELLSQAMAESLLLSESVEEFNIKSEQLMKDPESSNQGVDEVFGRLGMKSHASVIRVENVYFRRQAPISGILRAGNLTKLHLFKCWLGKSERSMLCKFLAAKDYLETFSSDIEFEVEELIPYWSGESDPRPDLNWENINIKSCEMIWCLRGFIRERATEINDRLKTERLAKMVLTTLEKSKNLDQIYWFHWRQDFLRSFASDFLYRILPEAQGDFSSLVFPMLQLESDVAGTLYP